MRKPIIGITRDSDGTTSGPTDARHAFYRDSTAAAGGEPLPIFYSTPIASIASLLDGLDGLLLSGGDDLDPALYGRAWHPRAHPVDARRQAFELALLAEAERRRLPILGICLGCQLINVHRGGSLIQFLPEERPGSLEHRRLGDVVFRHDVTIEGDSVLAAAMGVTAANVNTFHKQAVDGVGRGLRVVARASDGVIEGVEDASMPLLLGVQWHPERISGEPSQAALFRFFVERAARGVAVPAQAV